VCVSAGVWVYDPVFFGQTAQQVAAQTAHQRQSSSFEAFSSSVHSAVKASSPHHDALMKKQLPKKRKAPVSEGHLLKPWYHKSSKVCHPASCLFILHPASALHHKSSHPLPLLPISCLASASVRRSV
jgi:hypothetical protein